MTDRRRLLVALVLTGPVATEVDGLRKALGSHEVGRIAPHLTLVPPTNVSGADLEGVHAALRNAAEASGPLDLLLGPPTTFAPARRVVYLAVSGDLVALVALRAALFAGPFHGREEQRPFVAHVTLANRTTAEERDGALVALAHYGAAVRVETVTLLAEEPHTAGHPWHPVADVALRPATIVGRGGRELLFSTGSLLDERTATTRDAWLATTGTAPSREAQGAVGPGFYATAREPISHGGVELVAVASGHQAGDELVLDSVVVTPAARGLGIGSQLIGFVEQVARERGLAGVALGREATERAAAFFTGRGFRPASPNALVRPLGP